MGIKILPHSEAIGFILGGKSFFTIKNPKTSNRFTFKCVKHKEKDIFFVSVLTGPDKYDFTGTIFEDMTYSHSSKSNIGSDSQSNKVFKYVFTSLKNKTLPEFIQIWHSGKCGRCGRKLTTPESIQSGYGPGCLKKSMV